MDRDALTDRLREFEGVEIGAPRVGPDPVNEPMIRHWCEAMGDANPIYTDAEFAAASIHRGIVAPPTMLQAWTLRGLAPGAGAPRDRLNQLLSLLREAGFDSIVATDCEQEYRRYLRPGDRVTASEVIEAVSEQKATALGLGHFVSTRITYRDSRGEEVGVQRFRLLVFRAARDAASPAPEGDGAALDKPKRLRPVVSHDNAFFWEGVECGELRIQRCGGCGVLRHPPRPMCPRCQSLAWEAIAASGRGTIYSYVVAHHPPIPPFEYPHATGLIELEEGTRFVANLVDVDPARLEIGLPVEVVFREVEEGLTLPLFRPVGEAAS